MTEQERRRRRREMERRMRARQNIWGKEKQKGGLAVFRLYVASVLVGGCLLISLFRTETSEMVCAKVKETIARQITAEEWMAWKERVAAIWKDAEESLPAFEETEAEPEEKKVYQPDREP